MSVNRNLRVAHTYWPPLVSDKSGAVTFDTPVPLLGRWEDKQEVFKDVTGYNVHSSSVVYVNLDLVVGGWLCEGTSVEANPRIVTGAKEIQGFSRTPNIKGTEFHRKAFL